MTTRVRANLVFVWLALLSAALVFAACSRTATESQVTGFEEINVQRINIIEPDGKPRVIISNSERMAKAIWGGKEYQHQSHGGGGFLFYNDDGTEAGGMGFGNGRQGDQYFAGANLNFDQYQQDNTLQLIYHDESGKRTAGLRVKDRPDESLFPVLELIDKLARASSEAERKQLSDEIKELEKKYAGTAERFFVGKQLDDSIVKLADGKGRPRLVLKVDGKGEPSVEFLDESGQVVNRIADKE